MKLGQMSTDLENEQKNCLLNLGKDTHFIPELERYAAALDSLISRLIPTFIIYCYLVR